MLAVVETRWFLVFASLALIVLLPGARPARSFAVDPLGHATIAGLDRVPITDSGPDVTTPMSGPAASIDALVNGPYTVIARATARAPFHEVAAIRFAAGHALVVRVDGAFWLYYLGRDARIGGFVVDDLVGDPAAEVAVPVTQYDRPDDLAAMNETICGIGATRAPSCITFNLGVVESARLASDLRLELAGDGTTSLAGWESSPDGIRLRRERRLLRFPCRDLGCPCSSPRASTASSRAPTARSTGSMS